MLYNNNNNYNNYILKKYDYYNIKWITSLGK